MAPQGFRAAEISGTGALGGFSRTIQLPMNVEVHSAPRNPGDAVQDFDTEMIRLDGQIFGDPDFDLLRIQGGSQFGLPSPGAVRTWISLRPAGVRS